MFRIPVDRSRFGFACLILFLLMATAIAAFPTTVFAQDAADEEEQKVQKPLVIVNVASVDRLLGKADYIFAAAGRPEMSDLIGGLLANIRDLRGMDREKPFGVMVYLNPFGLTPRPEPVGYVPVSDIGELTQTMSVGPASVKKVEGEDNRYEMGGGRGLQILTRKNPC